MKRLTTLLITLTIIALSGRAQEMTVKSMEVSPFDRTASMKEVLDFNNNACGLVKVQLVAQGAEFGGNVIKPVKHETSQYLVYMTAGSKMLNIQCPGYLPMMVYFRDYGIQRIESRVTYVLTISLPQVYSQNSQVKTSPGDSIIDNLVANMIHVKGGTFMMGNDKKHDKDAENDEKPIHQVTLESFSIGKYEVTQAEWEAVMGNNPSKFKGADRPVENVSWNDCQDFITKLNAKTGLKFRLPTEAEWEYAARGGNKSQGYKYSGNNDIELVAWYEGNSGKETHSVGTKQPNELGIYDMSGNVWEWCQDWYNKKYYSISNQTNPNGLSNGSKHVVRGGCCGDVIVFVGSTFAAIATTPGPSSPKGARVSHRSSCSPETKTCCLGFRLAM